MVCRPLRGGSSNQGVVAACFDRGLHDWTDLLSSEAKVGTPTLGGHRRLACKTKQLVIKGRPEFG